MAPSDCAIRPVTVRSAQRLSDRPLTRLTLLTCYGACVARLARFLVWRRPRRRRDAPPGLRPSAHAIRRARLAGHLLDDRDGALADERDRHWLGADAVARDAAGGARGVEENGGAMNYTCGWMLPLALCALMLAGCGPPHALIRHPTVVARPGSGGGDHRLP